MRLRLPDLHRQALQDLLRQRLRQPPEERPQHGDVCLHKVCSLIQFYCILLTFHKQGSVCNSAFSTNAQTMSASAIFNGVLGTPRPARHTWRCPCFSVVLEATHEASPGPLKGAVSAQKALRGFETETRELLGGTEENSISR